MHADVFEYFALHIFRKISIQFILSSGDVGYSARDGIGKEQLIERSCSKVLLCSLLNAADW